MELLTQELRKALPKLGDPAMDRIKLKDRIVHAKFFMPDGSWTWFVLEGEPSGDDDFEFYGFVKGAGNEVGPFMLSELQSLKGVLGLPVERDKFWVPKTLKEVCPEEFKGG